MPSLTTRTALHGSAIKPMPKRNYKPETFPKGRPCSRCGHTLSVYNEGPECFRHDGRYIVRGDGEEGLTLLRELMEEA